jgi:hypothetical protein
MSPSDDDRHEELQRLALITRMLDDPGTASEFDDLLGEEEAAALLGYPDVRMTRKPARKATS